MIMHSVDLDCGHMITLRMRMYHLVLYSLSGIQKGIQAYHSGIEYSLKYGTTPEYLQWSMKDKTVIILDGGTSNREGFSEYDSPRIPQYYGSMEDFGQELIDNKILLAYFYEPDLNNATTAISFLVDERVWDKEKYPDPVQEISGHKLRIIDDDILLLEYEKLYGNQVAFLRVFLKRFKLA